jgi:hypothetical protein
MQMPVALIASLNANACGAQEFEKKKSGSRGKAEVEQQRALGSPLWD